MLNSSVHVATICEACSSLASFSIRARDGDHYAFIFVTSATRHTQPDSASDFLGISTPQRGPDKVSQKYKPSYPYPAPRQESAPTSHAHLIISIVAIESRDDRRSASPTMRCSMLIPYSRHLDMSNAVMLQHRMYLPDVQCTVNNKKLRVWTF